MNKLSVLLAFSVLAVPSLLISQEQNPSAFSPYVDADGAIELPSDYRAEWTHLGTYAVLDESEAGPGLHEVYTQRSNIEAYNSSGEWPDGAVLVKEVRRSAGAKMTTGDSHWATDINVWFVMIKDRQGRFPNNSMWGDGWRRTVPGEVVPGPLHEHQQPALEFHQHDQVDEQPRQPGRVAPRSGRGWLARRGPA